MVSAAGQPDASALAFTRRLNCHEERQAPGGCNVQGTAFPQLSPSPEFVLKRWGRLQAATDVDPAGAWHDAEDYHQKYYVKETASTMI